MKITNYAFAYKDQPIFDDFSVEFSSEHLNVLLGENGSGKSTLFDAIADVNGAKNQPIPKQAVAYKVQQPVLFPNLTVQEMINLFTQIGSLKFETETGRLIREDFLSKILSRKMGQLSGGERQLLFSYGTHLLDRDVYLFDEPTAGVSFSNAEYIIKMMQELVDSRGKTVVVTLHDLKEIETMPVHLITLKAGKVSFAGTKADMLELAETPDFEVAVKQLV